MIPLIVLVVLAFVLIGLYNSLINKKNQVDNAFGSIDALLKKRLDLIPNLVEVVKQYMQHEKSTLTEVTEMRTKVLEGNKTVEDQMGMNDALGQKMGGIMVAVENYPELKSNTNFLQLQGSWNEVEEQISAARRAYNAAVTSYNNGVEMFPTNIFANMMGYKTKKVFEIPSVERENVSAKDLFEG